MALGIPEGLRYTLAQKLLDDHKRKKKLEKSRDSGLRVCV